MKNHKNKTKTAQSNNYLLTYVVDRLIIKASKVTSYTHD